jgi:hypothetical protein
MFFVPNFASPCIIFPNCANTVQIVGNNLHCEVGTSNFRPVLIH